MGGDSVKSVDQIREGGSGWAQAARGEVPGFDDSELLVAFATWDEANTRISAYEAAVDTLIKGFKAVQRINELAPVAINRQSGAVVSSNLMGGLQGRYKAVYVSQYGQSQLGVVRFVHQRNNDYDEEKRYNAAAKRYEHAEYFWLNWVPDELRQQAEEKTRERWGTVDTIPMSAIKDYRAEGYDF